MPIGAKPRLRHKVDVRNEKMKENRTKGLGLLGHVLLGACLSVVALFAFCLIAGGLPSNANERFALLGRSPIYVFHFAVPGIVLGAVVFGAKRLLGKRKQISEPPAGG